MVPTPLGEFVTFGANRLVRLVGMGLSNSADAGSMPRVLGRDAVCSSLVHTGLCIGYEYGGRHIYRAESSRAVRPLASVRAGSAPASSRTLLQATRVLPQLRGPAHLVDHVLPQAPIRQWVLSFPYPLRFLFAARPEVLGQVLGVVDRCISTFLVRRSGFAVPWGVCPEQQAQAADSSWQEGTSERRTGSAARAHDLDAAPEADLRHRQIGRKADLHGRRPPQSGRAQGCGR